jgi:uncharacterized protein YlxW (UPF0749 family)
MPFGLGFGELIFILLTFAIPIAVLLVAVKAIARALGRGKPSAESRQLANELQQAQLQIAELENRIAQVDEKATFTQELLEMPRGVQQRRD